MKYTRIVTGIFVLVLTLSSLLVLPSQKTRADEMNTLYPNEVLLPGESLTPAPSSPLTLTMQTDGNLVIYNIPSQVVWSSGTSGNPDSILALQEDGNLVIYNSVDQPIWSTGTSGGLDTASLVMQSDGNLVLYMSYSAVWSSNTGIIPFLSGDQTLSSSLEGIIFSTNLQFRLIMQTDGNVVLYNATNQPVWNTGTAGNIYSRLVMQSDGNLVLYYDYGGYPQPIWSTGTSGNPGARLVVQTDGNLVVYNTSNQAVWSKITGKIPSLPASSLSANQSLNRGESLLSSDGRFKLILQTDCNLVMYHATTNQSMWSTGTRGFLGCKIIMQPDGNAVIYYGYNEVLWSTVTQGNNDSRLVMQTDGNLVIYNNSGVAIWSRFKGRLY